MKALPIIASIALAFAGSGAGLAATLSFNGSTQLGTTFHRPTGPEYPSAPVDADLHYIDGGEWSYHSTQFVVGSSGSYDFLAASDDFDIYLAVYTTFNIADPTSNLVALFDGNDSSPGSTYSAFLSGLSLQENTTYTLVVTSFWENTLGDIDGNTPVGAFQTTISGPGNITVIPEPSAALLGLAGAICLLRRRTR